MRQEEELCDKHANRHIHFHLERQEWKKEWLKYSYYNYIKKLIWIQMSFYCCGTNWSWTNDTWIFSPLLYHLSYGTSGISCKCECKIATNIWHLQIKKKKNGINIFMPLFNLFIFSIFYHRPVNMFFHFDLRSWNICRLLFLSFPRQEISNRINSTQKHEEKTQNIAEHL